MEKKNADKLNERFSKEEVERCVKRQKNGKAAGPDGIPYEMYKNDDVVVMNDSADELQSLLDVVDGYGRNFGVWFSSEKSEVMIVNRSEDESNAVKRTGENEMNLAREYKYLGMWVSLSGCEKTKNEKIGLVNQ
ncbi:hypothetical protein E2C01_034640 [Portunus trituberculatus]|uniref:Reverse transcriptase domain-containing protein n=1 Tax=Portunus trituberculatus TaxID=210409 RepID=A0A5B7F758_PORTR|nr:hypothetical protein [Portunus trituberculatus]